MARLGVAIAAHAGGAPLLRTLDSVLGNLETACATAWPAGTREPIAHAIRQLAAPRGPAVEAHSSSPGAVWNAAVRALDAETILCLYEGDALPAGLEPHVAAALEDPAVSFAALPIRLVAGANVIEERAPSAITLRDALADPGRAPQVACVRRSDWTNCGGFDEVLPALASYAFLLELLRDDVRRAAVLDGVSVRRTVWRGSPVRAELDPERRAAAIRRIFSRHREACSEQPRAMLLDRERNALQALSRHRELAARRDAAVSSIRHDEEEARRLEAFLRGHGRSGIDWGDLRHPLPVGLDWGYDRGRPVDRALIEQFIAGHAGDIRGRVLEVQEPDLTIRFGGAAVAKADVLDIDPANPRATVIADLRSAPALPSESYDCIILTQTLHVIDDMAAVVRECHRLLKPGGVLLATLPCASRVCLEYGPDGDFWRTTAAGVRRLCGPAFGDVGLTVCALGNVLTTTAFLQGLAAHEIAASEYAAHDPYNPTLVGVRAEKACETRTTGPAIRRGRRGRAVVLLYHRVALSECDPHGLAIPAGAFEEQMAIVASRFLPLALDDVLDAASRRHLPHRAVAVTFDDGYRDNLRAAAPVLHRYQVPAAFFVTTAPLEGSRGFWWDRLARIFAGTRLPAAMDLSLDGVRVSKPTRTAAERAAAHDAVYRLLVRLDRERLARALELLESWAGTGDTPVDADSVPLDKDGLLQLAASGTHIIGAHGVHHLYLPNQERAARSAEIAGSRRQLEDLLGRDIRWFAYPFGAYDDSCCQAVRHAGFDAALTCDARALQEGGDPYRVPRVEVRCRSGAEFERQLEQSLEDGSAA